MKQSIRRSVQSVEESHVPKLDYRSEGTKRADWLFRSALLLVVMALAAPALLLLHLMIQLPGSLARAAFAGTLVAVPCAVTGIFVAFGGILREMRADGTWFKFLWVIPFGLASLVCCCRWFGSPEAIGDRP